MSFELTEYKLEDALDALIDYRGKTPVKTNRGVPLITAKIIKGGRIEKPTEFIAFDNYDAWMRRGIPKAGDVVLTVEAPLGEVAQLGNEKVALAQRVVTLRGKAGVLDSTYLLYLLQTNEVQEKLKARASGSTVIGIKQSELRKVSISLPNMPTQRAVAKFLKSVDLSIDSLKHQNFTLEAIAQRLFRSWFVNFDPVHTKAAGKEPEAMSAELAALFPSEFEDSELGHIPKGWSVTTFGDAFDIKGGATPSTSEPLYWNGGTHAWATPKDMSSLASKVMYRTQRQITAAGVAKISSKALPAGTVLMSSRAPVGYLAIAKVPISINQGFIAIPPTQGIPASFTVELLAQKMPDIKANAGGTTFAEISKTQFRPIKWTRPSDKVLAAFGKLVEPLYAQVHGNCLLVDSLASLREHLLPRLISGKLSLEEAEQAMAEATVD